MICPACPAQVKLIQVLRTADGHLAARSLSCCWRGLGVIDNLLCQDSAGLCLSGSHLVGVVLPAQLPAHSPNHLSMYAGGCQRKERLFAGNNQLNSTATVFAVKHSLSMHGHVG